MPEPTKYVRGTSFAGFQASNPNRPLPGSALDNELENIEQSVGEAINGLNDIRRPDGKLRNGIVGIETLAPGIITGVNPATLWQTGLQYEVQDTVSFGAAFYRCLVAHVASTFLTDLGAGRWVLYADIGSVAADAQTARNEAVAAAALAVPAADAAVPAAAAATAAAANAATLYDLFDDRYLGEKTSLPTLDNDGNALVNGALVSLTGQSPSSANGMYLRLNGTWQAVVAPFQGAYVAYRYVATGGQTTFTGADANSVTLAYTPNAVLVTRNGAALAPNTFTASNGTSIVLSTGAAAGDVVVIHSFGTFSVASLTPNSSLATMAEATIKGRAAGAGTGTPQDLTPTEARAAMGVAETTLDARYRRTSVSVPFADISSAPTTYPPTDGSVTISKMAAAALATATQYRNNTADLLLVTDDVWTAAGEVALTDAATVAVDMATGFNFTVTLGGNRTLGNPTNTKVGQVGVIRVVQDGTGGRTLAFGANWKFAGGTAFSIDTVANRESYLSYYVRSSTFIVVSGLSGVR